MILFPLQMQPRAGRLWTFKIAWGLLVPASSASEIAYMNRLACQRLQTCPGLTAVAAAGCRPIWPLQINTITCKVCWIHLISDSWTLLHSLGGLNDCLVDTTGASAHFSFLPISNFESIIQVSGAKLLFVYICDSAKFCLQSHTTSMLNSICIAAPASQTTAELLLVKNHATSFVVIDFKKRIFTVKITQQPI